MRTAAGGKSPPQDATETSRRLAPTVADAAEKASSALISQANVLILHKQTGTTLHVYCLRGIALRRETTALEMLVLRPI